MSRPLRLLAALLGVGSVLLAGCGSSSAAPVAGAPIRVVTSTDVWGDIVKQIGGSQVAVTSFITDPAVDPHSYEASAQNELSLSKAALIIENGGGYDDFMDTLIDAGHAHGTILNAVKISGKQPVDGDLNEHVWYDFPTVAAVATQIGQTLDKADPAHAKAFQSNERKFANQLTAMEKTEADIKAKSAGTGVAITEPVPVYLLQACGLVNKTPKEFSSAIEGDTDVSAVVLQTTLDLFSDKQVKALVYNSQTSGPQTQQVLTAATSNGIAVVPVTETLPGGSDFISWMRANLSAVGKAVAAK